MPNRKIATLALSGLLALSAMAGAFAQATLPVPDPAIAAMTPDQMVAARQAAMKEDGSILRSAGSLTGADAEAAAAKLLANFTNFPALFADGATTPDSHALPAVWEHFDDFKAIFVAGQTAAAQMLDAAKVGDSAAYGTATQALIQTCGTCHQTYRGR